ncbi:acyl carrier protein [Glycomyces mayteni]|uniref:Acyl carrier protein n=1 Tax=Glycomyces mayteni TaxID=543887 RepID=A0ABW2D2I6_9ACTN|nr:hypothetical protein GCM10025732_50910 [Glycomyces mayteni]
MTNAARVAAVVAKWCQADPEDLTPDTRLEDLDLDSLSRLEAALGLQREFRVAIDDTRMNDAETIADVVEIVETSPAKAGD